MERGGADKKSGFPAKAGKSPPLFLDALPAAAGLVFYSAFINN
jgi:hypothetical protein